MIADGSEVYFLVRDSSVVHRTDPKHDGQRLLVACGREHGRQLVEQYRSRPFVDPEQWAAKIMRALDQPVESPKFEDTVLLNRMQITQLEARTAPTRTQRPLVLHAEGGVPSLRRHLDERQRPTSRRSLLFTAMPTSRLPPTHDGRS
ncbi:hypothetical protein P3T27_006587 [Kitasatospora sp. MAA19]|uniref:hypothetical protein n=1 Tax=Kitasatospora sp. MAA19 TaxID=3035090 RepID=UPI002476F1C0|nr:hypothetical protein [Kitasatospora sp. MAA19]MDH6709838.1 hypothetical protein [Kitasatospora sp. MAA19]